MSESYSLAPMSGLIRGMTLVLLAIPVFFVLQPLWTHGSTALVVVGWLVAGLYAAVWIWWRPGRFEVTSTGLRIVFPGRSRKIPMSDVARCRTLTRNEFRDEFGRAVRVGAGGLWGGFGWLWTSRRGLIDFYISRTDGLVLFERRNGRALLVTPENPEKMVASIAGRLAARA